ncbi:MAG: glycosyltransferase family 2 protein, partial [Candidatus Cryptobacteroides sp.]|nr:glycosyltransferase family 2 protein [Bacteroidales bacterium]MDY6158246.1 glycosyltransferase family 2 protein [Candidatus Cryptobacteroides sp.]
MSAKVLVVVVTWNAMRWIDRCLGSVADCGANADVMVVDNSSTDGTPARIRERFPRVMLVESGGNLGFGAANNIAFRYALEHRYDYVYLMNQDAWMEKNCLSRLLAAAREEFAVLSPVQKSANGKLDPRFKRKCGKRLKMIKHIAADDTLVLKVPFVMAAHWLVDLRALKTIGGFSPAFPHYGEDDNFIDRMHWWGLDCGIVPAASAVHDRAERKTPRSKRLELKCISTVVKLSDPG